MEKSIKGTETEKNLLKAFAGESQARNRYEMFSKKAKKEGLEQISGLFQETANQEKEHAKRFFSFLEGGDVEIVAAYPAGKVGHTAENLAAAAGGENEEWTDLYPAFAEKAKEVGLYLHAKQLNLIEEKFFPSEIPVRVCFYEFILKRGDSFNAFRFSVPILRIIHFI